MAVSVTGDLFVMTVQGDQILQPIVPVSVKFVPEALSVAGDVVTLIDPVTSGVLFTAVVDGPTAEEFELVTSGNKNTRSWPNGVEVGTLTGDRGTVYVRFA